MTESDDLKFANDKKIIGGFLISDGWASASSESKDVYIYKNAFATLTIEFSEGYILYFFKEDEIESLVKIDYRGEPAGLLRIIASEKKKLFSGQYVDNLKKIIDKFPNIYYFNGDRYTGLIHEDSDIA